MEIAAYISITAGICGIVFGLVSLLRNKKSDDASEGRDKGVILTELGYIKSGVDDIKRKQDKQDEKNLEFTKKLTEIDTSVKSAHRRIDGIETKIK